jgi:hypothetical protein
MSEEWRNRYCGFIVGVPVGILMLISLSHIRDANVIKQYTEGKIVCTTLADEFICREVEKE